MKTELIMKRLPVGQLKPAKYNPRKDLKPGDPAYEKIRRSLHDFGYVDPIVWNEVTGNIVGGHQRYKVLVNEGATEVDCVVVHIENPRDEKALNIALNKATGDWEPTALADLLQDLQLSGYDVTATGFDVAEVDDLFSKVHDREVKDDDCESDPETITPFVKRGDIWTLGKHTMMCGDSTSEEDVARLMGDVRANLVVTDPPYNVSYESADGKTIQNDSMGDEQFFVFLLTAFKNMAAFMAEGGSAYIFHADMEGINFRRAFKEAGFHISGVCIWVKNSLTIGRSPYQWQHEPVLFGWLPNGKHKWYADRKQTTIWNYDKPKKNAEHPTMKPIPLVAYPIKNSSAPNSVVMDLFGGSGSTLMVLAPNVSVLRKEALLELTRGLKELNIDMFFEAENIHTLSEDGEELISVLASFVKPKPEVPKLKSYGLEDEDEGEVVKRIFSMYMDGLARKPIAQILNKEQIPNRRGTPWKDYDIRRITMNPAYRETLIDPETFDAAQEKIEQRTKAFHYRSPYKGMFAGIITCGVCGRTYSRRERGVSSLWVCVNYMHKGPAGCPSKSIRERLLKEIVTPLLGEKGLEDVDRVDNITVYPDGRLIVTIDDEEIERVWR